MAQFIFNKTLQELIVAADQKLVILDYLTQKIKHVVVLPTNLAELISDFKIADIAYDEEEQGSQDKLKNSQNLKIAIQNVALAPNGKTLAVSTSGIKTLILFTKVDEFKWEILSVRKSNRASSALTFSPDSKLILLCDKSGDCFLYTCDINPPKWILGHLSSIYDVKFSFDGKYILTADRDEKIRVTNYPNSYEIESYCLGHKEYVCSIEILENHPNILVSFSGDKTFRLWKWREGLQLVKEELPAPGVKMVVRTVTSNLYELAFLIFQPNDCLFTYTLEIKDYETINITKNKCISVQELIITNINYIEGALLASVFQNNKLGIMLFNTDSSSDLDKFQNLKMNIETEFQSSTLTEPEDISSWFKKKFDNVSDYLQRKRQRLESKKNKKTYN
ncbi:tRNA (guanine-N(7)-)-methyltransferase non-catalytic subunit wuho [Condylostylus longicornis]|uniref:tRNA (guanine-N(7)-)-methyltransferase non-catalytic subunit wuho n=1 Tax=Condylostylus longicornis TaxID=2530218 RepID=UPI00244E409E|nr:tRNA (guanine-N(7)-)-methyltransferase non-catalytic subunit wuho [Condylostylus longicornis]